MGARHTASRRLTGAALAGIAALLSTRPVANAAPAAHPGLALRIGGQQTAGQRIGYSWNSTGLPIGEKLVLQRQQGTAHVWRTIAQARTHAQGSGVVGALGLGVYKLRLVAVNGHGKAVAVSGTATVHVFGVVPLTTLLTGVGGTVTSQQRIFTYAAKIAHYGGLGPTSLSFFGAGAGNSCRQIHLDVVTRDAASSEQTDYYSNVPPAIAVLTQASADAVDSAPLVINGTTRLGQSTTLDSALVPGQPWNLTYANADGFYFWVNGWLLCDGLQRLNYETS